MRSARTRRSYAGDLLGWRAWLDERGIELLGAGRVHVDVWVRAQQQAGAGDASVRRRLSGVGSFYRYCMSHDLASGDPTAGVARPRVDPDYTATVGLSREQGRALIAAADADSGRARLRSVAVIRLLLHNALRVDEALGADLADLGTDRGHQVLTVLGKGNRRAKVALTPATLTALHLYLEDRANRLDQPQAAMHGTGTGARWSSRSWPPARGGWTAATRCAPPSPCPISTSMRRVSAR